MDPFAVLGLPRAYRIDPAHVQQAYLRLSAAAHPDIGPGDPDAFARSADLNRAREILADPEQRAGALLAILGGPAKEADRSLPTGFLEEMMQAREKIDEARATGGGELRKWEAWAEDRRRDHEHNAAALFDAINPAAPDPVLLRQVRTELNAWRYIERLIEQLDPDAQPRL